MAKLYFRYGAIGSSKTLNLLAVAHNYRQQEKKVLLMKPDFDIRFGKERIKSRAGLEMQADILIASEESLRGIDYTGISCILVDEAQFLTALAIEELRAIALKWDIPVICYGLRTDFKSHLFEGSARLMELADSIEEVKSTCHYCNRKSTMNLKQIDGIAVNEEATIELGAEEKYYPTCYQCYCREIEQGIAHRLASLVTSG